jgi:hypothetical protein
MKTRDERILEGRVSDLILNTFNGLLDLPRGDFQGISEALAMKIIAVVKEAA